MSRQVDVVIIGAGAAGLMCAISAGQRGRSVAVLDHANKVGKKILMSGGGRCNFTNTGSEPSRFLSENPHFCKSALSRYTQWDFIALVEKHGIAYHEKKLGQLFCDNKSKDILNMLLSECEQVRADVRTLCTVERIEPINEGFRLKTSQGAWHCQSLVIASGGLSIPKMGATGFGYEVATQFGLRLVPRTAGLVPFTLNPVMLEEFDGLSGTSVDCEISCNGMSFRENLLFTHRGLSGPAVLQISSYWNQGDHVSINLLPTDNAMDLLKREQQRRPVSTLVSVFSGIFSRKLAQRLTTLWFDDLDCSSLADMSDASLRRVADSLHDWTFRPNGTEGYRTAEVTLGGVDCDELSSRTFECKSVPGLYFIGEVVDVTGHLGGYNFQWAWASGHAAGQYV